MGKDNGIEVRKIIDIDEDSIEKYSFVLEEEGLVSGKHDVRYDPIYLYQLEDMIYGAFVDYRLEDNHLDVTFCSYLKEHADDDFEIIYELPEKEEDYLQHMMDSDEVQERLTDLEEKTDLLSDRIRDFNEEMNTSLNLDNISMEELEERKQCYLELKDEFSTFSLLEARMLGNWGIELSSFVNRILQALHNLDKEQYQLQIQQDKLLKEKNKRDVARANLYQELGIPLDFVMTNPKFLVKTFVDEKNGGFSAFKLELVINYYYENGWKLYKIFTNTLGVNSQNTSINGFGVGNNSTIEETVVVFERMDSEV